MITHDHENFFYDSYMAFPLLPFTQVYKQIKSMSPIFISTELVAPCFLPCHAFGRKTDCTNGLAIGSSTLLVASLQVTAEKAYYPFQLIRYVNKQKCYLDVSLELIFRWPVFSCISFHGQFVSPQSPDTFLSSTYGKYLSVIWVQLSKAKR